MRNNDELEVKYAFAFAPDEMVLYTAKEAAGPFPGRFFLLNFWRHAKDGIMHLLGYQRAGRWREPTRCYPNSYVRYYKPSAVRASPTVPDTLIGRETINQLASRTVLIELEPGMYELPTTLESVPIAHRAHQLLARATTRRKSTTVVTGQPPLNNPIAQNIRYKTAESSFMYPAQAANELNGVVQVLKRFPELQIELTGNMSGMSYDPPKVFGHSKAENDYILHHKFMSLTDRNSPITPLGLMTGRAKSIKTFLVTHGIKPSRIKISVGGIYPSGKMQRVTITFSKKQ